MVRHNEHFEKVCNRPAEDSSLSHFNRRLITIGSYQRFAEYLPPQLCAAAVAGRPAGWMEYDTNTYFQSIYDELLKRGPVTSATQIRV